MIKYQQMKKKSKLNDQKIVKINKIRQKMQESSLINKPKLFKVI